MRHRIIAILTAALVMLGAVVLSAPAAHAGSCSTIGGRVYCGKVWNSSASHANLSITNNWPASGVWSLAPGKASTSYIRDADGFRVPSGCTGWGGLQNNQPRYEGGVWYKINDLTATTILVTC